MHFYWSITSRSPGNLIHSKQRPYPLLPNNYCQTTNIHTQFTSRNRKCILPSVVEIGHCFAKQTWVWLWMWKCEKSDFKTLPNGPPLLLVVLCATDALQSIVAVSSGKNWGFFSHCREFAWVCSVVCMGIAKWNCILTCTYIITGALHTPETHTYSVWLVAFTTSAYCQTLTYAQYICVNLAQSEANSKQTTDFHSTTTHTHTHMNNIHHKTLI